MGYPAESYEKYSVPALFAPWAAYLIESANVKPGEHILDVACGTGVVARQVAARVGLQGRVIGLDRSPNMLRVAHALAEQDRLAIEWRMSPAEQLPFPDDSFDLILCQFGLMFFSDQHQALTEMYRVLKTEGRVVISVWQGMNRHPFYQILHEVSLQHLGISGVEAVFSLGDSNELRGLLADAGFEQIQIIPMSITARYSNPAEFLAWESDVDPAEAPALQHLDAQARQAIMDAFREDMEPRLQEFIRDGQVVLASHAHVTHARKGVS